MFNKLIYFVVIIHLCCDTVYTSNCLDILNGEKCSEIQLHGQTISTLFGKIDSLLEEIAVRFMNNWKGLFDPSLRIVTSSLLFIKNQLLKTVITPVETKLDEKIRFIKDHTMALIHRGNIKIQKLISSTKSSLVINDDVLQILLSQQSRGRRSLLFSKYSIAGIVNQMQTANEKVLDELLVFLKQSTNELFDLLSDSLKVLINGIINLDLSNLKKTISTYFAENFKSLAESILERLDELIKEMMMEFQDVSAIVSSLKRDSNKMDIALQPAKQLISEVLKLTQTATDREKLEKTMDGCGQVLKDMIADLKKAD